MKRILEQRSELQVAKCLIVHVLYSSFDISRLELRNIRKTTQQWSLCVANDIRSVYIMRVYAYNVVSSFWYVRSFCSQHYSKFITNITSKKCPRSVLKNARPHSSIARKIWRSFCILRDTSTLIKSFYVIVSFLNEIDHGFNNFHNGKVKTRFQIVEFWLLWTFLVEKHKFSLHNILVLWWVGTFWNCNLPLTFYIDSVALVKKYKRAECIVRKQLRRCIWNQLYSKRFYC